MQRLVTAGVWFVRSASVVSTRVAVSGVPRPTTTTTTDDDDDDAADAPMAAPRASTDPRVGDGQTEGNARPLDPSHPDVATEVSDNTPGAARRAGQLRRRRGGGGWEERRDYRWCQTNESMVYLVP